MPLLPQALLANLHPVTIILIALCLASLALSFWTRGPGKKRSQDQLGSPLILPRRLGKTGSPSEAHRSQQDIIYKM